jgi:hypothetical protein
MSPSEPVKEFQNWIVTPLPDAALLVAEAAETSDDALPDAAAVEDAAVAAAVLVLHKLNK